MNESLSGCKYSLKSDPNWQMPRDNGDIDDQINNSRLLKFADNTKIYFKVNSPENIERLREDLCKLVSWSKEWQMLLFNVEKCKVMHLGYDNPHASYLWMVIDYK